MKNVSIEFRMSFWSCLAGIAFLYAFYDVTKKLANCGKEKGE